MGHLGNDPELRQTKNGKLVATFSLATDRDWKDSTGEKHKKVDFHKIIAWQKLAEQCEKFLKKGSAVMVNGRLTNNSYETNQGEKKFVTEINAREINIITWKNKKEDSVEETTLTGSEEEDI